MRVIVVPGVRYCVSGRTVGYTEMCIQGSEVGGAEVHRAHLPHVPASYCRSVENHHSVGDSICSRNLDVQEIKEFGGYRYHYVQEDDPALADDLSITAIAFVEPIDACRCSCLDCGQAGVSLWYRGFDKLVGVNTLGGAHMDEAGT